MQLTKWWLGVVLVALHSFGWAQQAPTPEAQKIGTIKLVAGDVTHKSVTGDTKATVGASVFAGDKLITASYSNVSLVLRDQTVIMVGSKTELDLSKFEFDSTTQDGGMLITLLKGSLRMVTGLIAKVNPKAIEVRTPTLSVGVRGTDFVVEAN